MEHAQGETGRAIDALRACMLQAKTGRLRVYVPSRGECSVYLMDGEVIAALTTNDVVAVIDRLVARGRIASQALSRLRAKASRAALGFDDLHREVEPALVGRLMAGRFRDNLVFYLFDGGRFVFEPLETVRVEHIQMGHDSAGLLRELEVVHGRILPWMGLEKGRVMGSGPHTPGSPQQRHIQALCTSRVSLEQLLKSSPFFVSQTLVLVEQMVDAGSLEATPVDTEEGPAAEAIDHAIRIAIQERERRAQASMLPAFADHELQDRGLGKGAFRGETDRVDLGRATETRTPGLRHSVPQLGHAEISRRVGVCNEVLTALTTAWIDQHGLAEGRRTAQLLVDGAPLDTAALFRAILVDSKGRIGPAQIIENLGRRPVPERRELLTKGLSDLIDRSLAKAAEGLDDDRLSTMLQQVAGYRERLGW